MLRTIPAHLIAIAVLFGTTAFALRAIGADMPRSSALGIVALTASYAAMWIGLLAWRVWRTAAGHGASWRTHDRLIMWTGSLVTGATLWLVMPYASESLQLVIVIFYFGPMSAQALGSIERPPSRRRIALMPLVPPLMVAGYFLTHWGPYSAAVSLFAIAYAGVATLVRDAVQRAVDRTFVARQAAEAALVELAAERDAKTRFLASASHDLAAPLQAARLFFDQTLRAPDARQRERAAQRVGWAFDTTEDLLRRILDHLRLESGAVQARVGRVALGPLIARVVEMNEPSARIAGMELTAMATGLLARADPELVERALGNLVGNAVRHAKGRRVLVGARRRGECVRIWVIDDGAGVSEADAGRLFDDYVQGSDHGDEVRGGFGLGLASARRMAGLMGGAVGLDVKWRKGSAFWLELPGAEAKAD